MRLAHSCVLVIVGLMLSMTGCQKASNAPLIDETIDVPSNETKAKIIDGPRREQKISVTAQASTGSFGIYVVREKDRAALEDKLTNLKPVSSGFLAKKEKSSDATLEAVIPAGEDFAVVLANGGAKPVQVKLKVINLP
jgi:hypothetical protein